MHLVIVEYTPFRSCFYGVTLFCVLRLVKQTERSKAGPSFWLSFCFLSPKEWNLRFSTTLECIGRAPFSLFWEFFNYNKLKLVLMGSKLQDYESKLIVTRLKCICTAKFKLLFQLTKDCKTDIFISFFAILYNWVQ